MSIGGNFWKYYLAIGTLFLATFFFQLSPAGERVLLVTAGLVSTLVALAGVWFYKSRPFFTWYLLAIGCGINSIGDLIFSTDFYINQTKNNLPVSNIVYLVGTLSFIMGLLIFCHHYRKCITKDAIINGLILAFGLVVAIWVLGISPSMAPDMGISDWLGTLAFSAGLFIIISLLSIYLMTPVGKLASYYFLISAAILFGLGMAFYRTMISQPLPLFGGPQRWFVTGMDTSYAAAYLLLSTANIHPSIIRYKGEFSSKSRAGDNHFGLISLGFTFLIIPGSFLIRVLYGRPPSALFVIGSMVIVFVLVFWRLSTLVVALENHNYMLDRQQDLLRRQAYTDTLTGLPNRNFLIEYLEVALKRAFEQGCKGALLMIDLDNFKAVNDKLGHDHGDHALKKISGEFFRLKRKNDSVVRFGGDEFIFLLEKIDKPEDAASFAERLHQEVKYITSCRNKTLLVTISIGIAVFPEENDSIQDILKRADVALYEAKKNRSGYSFYQKQAGPD